MNGRPTCLTVSHPTTLPKKKTESKETIKEEENSTQENNNERRQRQESGKNVCHSVSREVFCNLFYANMSLMLLGV